MIEIGGATERRVDHEHVTTMVDVKQGPVLDGQRESEGGSVYEKSHGPRRIFTAAAAGAGGGVTDVAVKMFSTVDLRG